MLEIPAVVLSKVGLPINGQRVELLDTPGIGDMDITPTKLISLLEERLGSHHQVMACFITLIAC